MKPRILIMIDTYAKGGPGKGIIQFLKSGGMDLCEPVLAGFWRGQEGRWQFREAAEATGVRFEVLVQRHAFDPSVIRAALKLVLENKVEVLQSHGYKSLIVCLALKYLTRRPWVAFFHGWTSENAKIRCYNHLEKVFIRFADRIIPVSQGLGARLELKGKAREKMETIPNAVELPDARELVIDVRERYGVAGDEVLIGVVGRLSPEKGHQVFVDAMKIIAERHHNVKAMLVGEGQERNAISMAVRRHGLEEKIILAGYQEEIASFYRAFDIVALPSLAEGMPNAALEAMAYGKPVVASNVGGIPEVVLDGITGRLTEAANTHGFAYALEEMLESGEKRKEFGLAGRERVETKFDPRLRVRKIVKVYEDLLERNL